MLTISIWLAVYAVLFLRPPRLAVAQAYDTWQESLNERRYDEAYALMSSGYKSTNDLQSFIAQFRMCQEICEPSGFVYWTFAKGSDQYGIMPTPGGDMGLSGNEFVFQRETNGWHFTGRVNLFLD